jgi:C_GCAxxG_C_C family probable redox protein
MSDAAQVASSRFARGFSCAQSIFSAFAAEHGVDDELALRLAAPFGGGIGRAGETCGALSGALMVLGLRFARSRPEYKDEIYAITREFVAQFRQKHTSILCRELVGYDIATPEGLQAARAENAFARVCPALVDETAQALDKFISEHLTE